MDIPSLEQRLSAIEARNTKVEAEKAWETSVLRRITICLLTYLIAGFLLYLIGSNAPWFYALIPVAGYFLSTLTLPLCRHAWQRVVYDKK
jgi:uncharacterized membrane protein YiaA